VPDFRRYVVEVEREHRADTRHRVMINMAVHVPQEQLGVEILITELTDPPDTPGGQRLHDRPEFHPRG
jgi:hypothetical protein